MDRGVRLGLAAQRRVFELVREVAGGSVDVGKALVQRLRDERVLRLDEGAFLEFDDVAARACLRDFLGEKTAQYQLSRETVPLTSEPLLRLWDSVDLPMPLKTEWKSRPEWLEQLLMRGLVRDGARGLRMTMRLRLHLWLSDEPVPTPDWPINSPVWQVLRALRKEGRWHEAALWARALADTKTNLLERHPSVPVTIALGLVQSQHFTALNEWFEKLDGEGRLDRVFSRKDWSARMRAVKAFSDIERGNPRPPAYSREARFWFALVRCWWHLYAGNYRRALRMLEFLQRNRSPRFMWVDPVIASWKATAYYYLEQYADSRDWNRRAIELAVENGWQERQMILMRNLALALFETGEVEQATAMLRGLARRHLLFHRVATVPGVLGVQSSLLNFRVRLGSGAWTSRQALHLLLRSGAVHQYAYVLEGKAQRARRCAEFELAEQIYHDVEKLATRIGDPLAYGNAVWSRARLTSCLGNVDGAFELLNAAEEAFAGMHQFTRAADMKCDRAMIQLELGRIESAASEIEGAHSLYASHGWPREAALIDPLRLELTLRRAPGELSEEQLDALRSSRQDTQTRSAYTYAIVALGFALLDDEVSSSSYSRDTLASVNRLQDPFMVGHILNLGRNLIKHSRTVEDVVSFWSRTFPFQENQV